MNVYNNVSDIEKDKIKKFIENNSKWYTVLFIKNMIKEKFNVIIGETTIRNMIKKIRENLQEIWETLEKAIKEVNSNEKKEYDIIEKNGKLHYKLDAGKVIYEIPVEDIDRMFQDYSSYGNDLSGKKMMQKYEIKPQAWATIKSRLSLVKDSDTISPYTLEHSSPKEVEDLIEKAIENHINAKKWKFVNTYEKRWNAEAVKAMKIIENKNYELEMIQRAIEVYEPRAYDFVPEHIEGDAEAHFIIGDIHFGKMDHNGVVGRMNEVYNEIITNPSRIIHITCLWDLVETIAQGWMHPNQLDEWMDPTFPKGFDAMMETVKLMEKWLTGLAKAWKEVYFKWLTGNHDRMTQNKEFDHRRTWGLVMYELLKRGLSQLDIDVQYYREFIVNFVADNIEYIAIHGDGSIGTQIPEKLIIAHAKTDKYKVLLSADKHCLKMSEWKNYTEIKTPAMAWTWLYDTDMNLHGEPGYLHIERNKYNTADIHIKRLSNF